MEDNDISQDTSDVEERSLGAHSPQSSYVVPGAIILAGMLIAGAVVYSNGSRTGGGAAGSGGKGAIPIGQGGKGGVAAGKIEDDDPMLGNPNASVTIVEFGDFQCPYCGRFFKTTEHEVIEKYVKTGKAKFVYRDFAFLGPESEWAAEAAECANAQGKFWEYHDYLFTHQSGENQGAFSKDNLKRFAQELRLDATAFNACLDSDKYLAEVQKDTEDGRALGVSGTPANFVNGCLVTDTAGNNAGAIPFTQLAPIIENAFKGK